MNAGSTGGAITLRPTNLHWINRVADDPKDLCAHSGVEFRVDEAVLAQQSDGDWTVSAAALYLLRTLSQPHTRDHPVSDHLFPCCGFSMYDVKGEEDVVVCGCPSGLNFGVVRVNDQVVISDQHGTRYNARFLEWRNAVCAFSDAVQAFYAAASPKEPADQEDEKGFQKFLREWGRRRSLAETQT